MEKKSQNPFANQATLNAAKKIIIAYIQYRFKGLTIDLIEDIAIMALTYTLNYQEAKTLKIPIMAFCKMVAFAKAIDEDRKIQSLRRRGISFVDECYAYDISSTTEGLSDEAQERIDQIVKIAKQQLSTNSQKLFEADYFDEGMEDLTDAELAKALDLTSGRAVSKRRSETKALIIRRLKSPQQSLRVSYRRTFEQRA